MRLPALRSLPRLRRGTAVAAWVLVGLPLSGREALGASALAGGAPPPAAATALPPSPLAGLEWRSIGPANMGGRVADIEGVPGNPRIVYVGSASGGVWKTTNGGTTWKPLFDKEAVASIGDIALEPGNPEVVYVGTGESNVRNSVSFGRGVYKSTDGGATWKHLGLSGTERISRIVVSPPRCSRTTRSPSTTSGAGCRTTGPGGARAAARSPRAS